MNKIQEEIIAWSKNSIFRIESKWLDEEILNNSLEIFKTDYRRYYLDSEVDILKVKYFPGLLCTLLYRLARSYYLNNQEEVALEFSALARFLTGIELYYSSEIGSGLKINHGAALVVGARTRIGSNCLLHQNVTIGDRKGGRPTIGDNVIIYPGSSVLGNVIIGDNVIIGAHTLVVKDVEHNKIIFGNPSVLKN